MPLTFPFLAFKSYDLQIKEVFLRFPSDTNPKYFVHTSYITILLFQNNEWNSQGVFPN